MLKKYYFVLVLMLLISPIMAQNVPSYVPKDGLVGWWPFNGNANDESGNGNNGTVNGAILSNDRNNNLNSAYHLNGQNNNIFIEKNFFDNGALNWSISTWYKLDELANPNNGNSSHMLFNTNPHHGLCLAMNWGSSSKYSIFAGNGTPSESWNILFNSQSNQNVVLNSWKNVVLVKTNKIYNLYIDGVLDFKWTTNDSVTSYFYKMYFGATDPINSNEVLHGSLDDIAIYNRALSQEEITALFTGVPACVPPTAEITSKSSTEIKENESVVLTASSGIGYKYTWYQDGKTISNANASNYSVTVPGIYKVKIISPDNCTATSPEILVKHKVSFPTYLPTNGLMGWWPFNGNANDESGNGNDGVVSNVELTYDRFQKPNSCYSFNGKDSRIETVTQFFDVSLHSYTLSLWINTLTNGNVNNYNDSQPLLNTDKHNGVALGCLGPNNPFGQQYNSKYIVGIGSNPDQRVWDLNFDNSNTGFKIKSWEHLVLIKNGFNFSFYVNGILDKTFTISSNPIKYNAKMVFGALSKEIIAEVFNGQLDDIAIYNHALSEQEIKQLFQGCAKETATSSSFNSFLLTTGNSVALNAEPQGGVFTGASIENNQFVPSKSKVGLNKVQYAFKNSQGCNDSTVFVMIVADTVGNICKKYDTVTVKNNVFDTVIVPKTVTKYDTITLTKNVTKYDTITVTNNVTKYDTLKVTKYDTINVTKYDTVKVIKFDTITVKNNVYDTVTITNNVTKYDTLKVTKFDTITIKNNVYDTVTITNNVTKYDTITLTDTVSILKITFKLTTGIQANQMANMSVYPNPTMDVLHIEVGDAKALEGYRYRILDALGKEVYNEFVKNAITEIPLKSLGAAGMYQFEVVDAKNIRIQANKIVLQ